MTAVTAEHVGRRVSAADAAPHRLDPGIEGLRALAVLAVLLHHAFPARLPGGFCGVDVFFVISGYLIGGKLLSNARAGGVPFARFYAARARRLFPALVVVLAATWIAGAWLMTGPEFAALGQHAMASAAFTNNLLLATESGYFDAPAATKPLMHLWSLGVEEQFYLVAPVLVWLGWKRGGRGAVWILRLGAASLLWTLWFWDLGRSASFFDPAFRFWELAAGVALAALRSEGSLTAALRIELRAWAMAVLLLVALQLATRDWSAGTDAIAAAIGLGLLAAVALLLVASPATGGTVDLPWQAGLLGLGLLLVAAAAMPSANWPGPQTVIPVAGTFLVLASPRLHEVVPVLRHRWAVAIGGISYPLYLWHWPILVFMRLLDPHPGAAGMALVLAGSVALAWLTKVCVEQPVRFGRFAGWKVQPVPVRALFAALLLLGAAGWAAHATGGLPQRFSPSLREIAHWSDGPAYGQWRVGECYYYLNESRDFAPPCSPAKRAGHPTVLLWGDSHAAHLYPGLAEEARANGFQLAQWTMGSCPPTLRKLGQDLPSCAERRAGTWEKLRSYTPDVVVLSAAWNLYLRDGIGAAELAAHVRQTVDALQRLGVRQVLVVGDGPVWNTTLPADLYRHMARHFLSAVPDRLAVATGDLSGLDAVLRTASEASRASYLSVLATLCDGTSCRTVGDRTQGRPDLLYWDRDHLTASGARLVAQASRPTLLRLLSATQLQAAPQ